MRSATILLVLLSLMRMPLRSAAAPSKLSEARAGHKHRHKHSRRRFLSEAVHPPQHVQTLAQVPAEEAGATLTPAPATPPDLTIKASFFATKSAIVEHDLLRFRVDPTGVNPPVRGEEARSDTAPKARFLPPPQTDDLLELKEQRDRLLLVRGKLFAGANLATGVSAFIASTMLAAHAPKKLRILFDGAIHVGPALFENGGMGMGVGGVLDY